MYLRIGPAVRAAFAEHPAAATVYADFAAWPAQPETFPILSSLRFDFDSD
jgi:hypothetical protein